MCCSSLAGKVQGRFGVCRPTLEYNACMTQEAAELLKKALALPAPERADLASTLIDSLDATVDENVEAAWQEEIRQRIDDLRSGKVTAIPWEDVREKARTLLHDPGRVIRSTQLVSGTQPIGCGSVRS